MNPIEVFQAWFAQENDSNAKMLSMLESVPEDRRSSSEFQRAAKLAGHVIACRKNWLIRIKGEEQGKQDWWPMVDSLPELRSRAAETEQVWSAYIKDLSVGEFNRDFEFTLLDGRRVRSNVRVLLMQLVGHSFYHRGQIALLVDSIGGETVDTDFLAWVVCHDPG